MKMLTVALLVCAMMALSEAAESSNINIFVCSSRSRGWKWNSTFNSRRKESPGQEVHILFRYVPTSRTWARAERNCQSMGANLASVHSAEDYHEIQKMIVIVSHSYGPTWIGGSDAQEEGIWFWSDASPFNYLHCGGLSNYQGRQHCLQVNYGADKCWDDVECGVDRPFVCAKKP